MKKIATVWHDDPESMSWLKAIAESNLYDSIRMAAVDELAKIGKDDPVTIQWLKKLATTESFEITRPQCSERVSQLLKTGSRPITDAHNLSASR